MEESKTNVPENDEEQTFEISPDEATSLDGSKPIVFNRKKLLIVICIAFSVVICGGLIFNSLKPAKKSSSDDDQYASQQLQSDEFISSLQNRAIRARMAESAQAEKNLNEDEEEEEPETLLPAASIQTVQTNEIARQSRNNQAAPVQQQPQPQQYQEYYPSGGSQQVQEQPTYYFSSLVPQVQGSLFSQGAASQQQSQAASANRPSSYAEEYFSNPAAAVAARTNAAYGNQVSDYNAQNDQAGKQSFYDSANGGTVFSGQYLGENSVWAGTIIPGILQTSINTDLPGNVIARTTQNIFDSRTGKILLIPQGTLLIARYNSSVSYAQNRVQIVWDTLIRPDGYMVDLDGANSVDRLGMSGQAAIFHENWFEYLKAAGIISMFSIANSAMTDSAAQNASGDIASNIAMANNALVGQLSSNMISRAMNIQPRLTVGNGTLINIMLNKTVYLPEVENFVVNQKYKLE